MKYNKLIKAANQGTFFREGTTAGEIHFSGRYLFTGGGGGNSAVSWYFQAYETENITAVGVVSFSTVGSTSFLFTGTDSALNIELRSNGPNAPAGQPGSLVATGLIPIPSGTNTNTWMTGSCNLPVEAGKAYHLCIGDADGNPTGYSRIYYTVGGLENTFYNRSSSFTTTNAGWTGGGARRGAVVPMYFTTDRGNVRVCAPFQAATTSIPSSTGYRGWIINSNVRLMLSQIGGTQAVWSEMFNTGANNLWSFHIFESGVPPTGVPFKSIYLTPQDGSYTNSSMLRMYTFPLEDRFIFEPGKTYRAVWRPAYSTFHPSIYAPFVNTPSILTSAETVTDGLCSVWGSTYHNTGTNQWVDNHTSFPTSMGLNLTPVSDKSICI